MRAFACTVQSCALLVMVRFAPCANLILAIHLLVTLVKLLRPGGLRAVVAESLLLNIRS
jgi:hypothetical protein